MKGIAKLFLGKGDIHDLIPTDSPWYWAWGFQGLRAVIAYRRLDKLLSSSAIPDQTQDIEAAEEYLAAARFSCRYGRTAPKKLRQFIGFVEEKRIVPHGKLRSLVHSGEIHLTKEDNIAVGQKPIIPLLGITLVTTLTLGLISLLHDILITDASLYGKLLASLFVATFFLYNISEFYRITVKPYLLVVKMKSILHNAFKKFSAKPDITLSLVR